MTNTRLTDPKISKVDLNCLYLGTLDGIFAVVVAYQKKKKRY